jgi:hypothetical protein
MIMACRVREGLLHFVFCDKCKVVDEQERNGDEDENDVQDPSGY